jgi:hypothetical protein
MDATLVLAPDLERRFWALSGVRRQLQVADALGHGFNMALNILAVLLLDTLPQHSLVIGSMAALQLFLIVWSLARVDAYMRWRLPLVLLQRLRWLLLVGHTCYYRSAGEVLLNARGHLVANAGSWGAFVVLAAYMPLLTLLHVANLTLPFRLSALLSLATLALHTRLALPHQVQALQDYRVQHYAQPACEAVQSAVLAPVMASRALSPGWSCCGGPAAAAAAARLLFSWLFVVVAVLLPLHFQHYWEYTSKAAFLRAVARQDASSGGPYSSALLCAWAAFVWSALAITWLLLCAYH